CSCCSRAGTPPGATTRTPGRHENVPCVPGGEPGERGSAYDTKKGMAKEGSEVREDARPARPAAASTAWDRPAGCRRRDDDRGAARGLQERARARRVGNGAEPDRLPDDRRSVRAGAVRVAAA